MSRKPSEDDLRVDLVQSETLGLPGRLGMTICPGVKDAGRWDRELEPDLDRLKQHYEVDTLVTLLESHEFNRYAVPDLIESAREAGLEVVHFPIKDVDTPRKAQSREYVDLIERLVNLLRDGKTVVVHCRGGLGRTGTVATSVLAVLGHDADDAIDFLRGVRRDDRLVETPEQEEYVRNFMREYQGRGRNRLPDMTLAERYRGCLLGLAACDALGTTLEFKPPGSFRPINDMIGGGPFNLRPGEWTDDTSMALCLAESLIERRGFDPANQMTKYLRWYREGHMSTTGVF